MVSLLQSSLHVVYDIQSGINKNQAEI